MATAKYMTEISRFLGLAGYCRIFIEGFAKIANPLTALTHKPQNRVNGAFRN